ncbi:hypothetical protein [Psychroflexus aestuariivivens]|uniref:hypothetical protein n=1 Tax=Psychroflexus aestuariivivens TaxID=1795040 RepID=UPI000FDB8C66|nr:hypothetical protein [Psychroflexus aestuariivivens]
MNSQTNYIKLKSKYEYLSDEDIQNGIEDITSRLVEMNEFKSVDQAKIYINQTIEDFMDDDYLTKFNRILGRIDKRGIAITDSFQKNLFSKMRMKLSILNYFNKANYEKSPLKQAVHNAFQIFHNSPHNSIIKF